MEETNWKNLEKNYKKQKQDFELEQKPIMQDVYDLYSQLIKTHSPSPDITPDFTITDYSEDNKNNKTMKFIKEQLKMCIIIRAYFKEDIHLADESVKVILNEIYSMVIMQRASKGQVLKAILDYGKNASQQQLQQEQEAQQNQNILDKKKPQEEKK